MNLCERQTMNKKEQIKFVEDLTESLRVTMKEAIIDEKIPDTWDGIELRALLHYFVRVKCSVAMSKSRQAEFDNFIRISNF